MAQRGAQRAVQDIVPYLRMLVVGDIRARSYATGQPSLDDETTLAKRRGEHNQERLLERENLFLLIMERNL